MEMMRLVRYDPICVFTYAGSICKSVNTDRGMGAYFAVVLLLIDQDHTIVKNGCDVERVFRSLCLLCIYLVTSIMHHHHSYIAIFVCD